MRTHLRTSLVIAVIGLVTLVTGALAAGAPQDAVSVVRQATAQFHDVEAAKAAGYELGYVNGPAPGSSPAASRTRPRASWAITTSTRG